jgi:ribulose-5-phosphate 4-epimerase/fuculose-1-phosphate aldolase
MDKFLQLRESIIQITQALSARGFFGTEFGTAGNVSARFGKEELVGVTPSSQAYQDLKPVDICIIDFDLNLVSGERVPSVEASMHLSVYRNRPDVGAVLHTHQHYASVLSVINEPIPPLFDEVSLHLGDPIEVVPYGMSGSPELMANVTAAVGNGCNAYVLQNHGALCLGKTLEEAVTNTELLEKTARVYYHALCAGKKITLLPPDIVNVFQELRKAKASS